jgi:alpha-glucosidase (family GH31 glycosyl hydrolase)
VKKGSTGEPVTEKVEPVKDGTITSKPGGFDVQLKKDVLEVRAVTANAFRVHYLPDGKGTEKTRVIDPSFKSDATYEVKDSALTTGKDLVLGQYTARWNASDSTLSILNTASAKVMTIDINALKIGNVNVEHNANDRLYGINGSGVGENPTSLFRNWEEGLNSGDQGHAGAPFVWSTAGYGVLVDTMGSASRKIDLRDNSSIKFLGTSKIDTDAYLLLGRPPELFGALAKISGRSPLFPKWAMGFTNSQWGANDQWDGYKYDKGLTEDKLRAIIQRYHDEDIPLDAFTFDLDWMYWAGADIPYSQFKWNLTKFPGMAASVADEKKLKPWLDEKGIKLTAILKPRIPVESQEGKFAESNNFWMPYTTNQPDYFLNTTQMRHLNFAKPEVTAWYFDHLKGALDSGISGWWNDEFDSSEATDDGNETEGFDMQRAVYEWQRSYAPKQRVWSINRNFYLGAQRYAYGLWSGDIDNGFGVMADQRKKMLSAINAGAMQWTMDTGGFRDRTEKRDGKDNKIGTQSEDYTRWMQFAIFTPIFRVHGDNGIQRQPWYYRPNKPGTNDPQDMKDTAIYEAIKLRYKLIPYIYSYEYQRNKTGVGIVRPLLFDWPEDENVANNVDSWLFGDWLLASPVVQKDQANKDIYLPAGNWTEWNAGNPQTGGRTMNFGTGKWEHNFPLFIRQGAIIPMMHEDVQYVGQKPLKELDVEVFPDTKRTSFEYYDDDGKTYDYEKGAYFLQNLSVERKDKVVTFETAVPDPAGSFKPELEYYTVKVYPGTDAAKAVSINGQPTASVANLTSLTGGTEGWMPGSDSNRNGIRVIYIRLKAQVAQKVEITLQ